jgi:hypothetical protein
MVRTLYIVAVDHPQLFNYLRDSLPCDGQIQVILDRRVSERRQRYIPRLPDRRQAERRVRPDVDRDLELRAHAMLTLPDNATGPD